MRIPVSKPWLGEAEAEAVAAVVRGGQLTQAGIVQGFEKRFAEELGVEHAVACSSGTAALHLTMAAMRLGPGDEVLVPDLSFVATANAVTYTGATPVLVDVDPHGLISLRDAETKISPRTRAIIPVHLYGRVCDMDAVTAFANGAELAVIEDAAEALGGCWGGRAAGTLGDAGCFSFYGNKVITTGEGGMVVTRSAAVAERLRHLRGQALVADGGRHFCHDELGFNYRMTELQAVIGLVQLDRLQDLLEARRRVFREYSFQLKEPIQDSWAPWLFTVYLPPRYHCPQTRDALVRVMAGKGVETRPVFEPMHRLAMYRGPESAFPVASKLADTGISLPTYPQMTMEDVDVVVSAMVASLKSEAA